MAKIKFMDWLRRLSHGSLRAHLFALVLVSILPILFFAVFVLNLFAHHEKAALATGLRETARALSSAMDREFEATKTALEAMATMDALDSGDLAQYYRTLRRILQSRPHWKTIVLHDPNGAQLLNLLGPFGEPRPEVAIEQEGFQVVRRTKQPVAINFYVDPVTGATIGYRVPVLRGGELKYILSAEMEPRVFSEILARQKLPAGAVATIIDGRNLIVATSGARELVGSAASPLIRAVHAQQLDGWFEGVNREGAPAYAAFSRSPTTAWAVALTVPAALLEGPLKRSLWALGGAGAIFLVAGILGAVVIESRISEPLSDLTRKAQALGRGEPLVGQSTAPIREMENLGGDLQRAAVLLTERGRQRDQAEGALLDLNERLERRISERTEELEDKNSALRREISERHAAEEALRAEHVYLNLLRSSELASHDAPNIAAVFSGALTEICRHLGVPVGYGLVQAGAQSLRLWQGDPQRSGLAELREALEKGVGPGDLEWETGKIVHMNDLSASVEAWARAAGRAGLRSVWIMRVSAGGQTAGVLAFFSEWELPADGRLPAVLDQLALQLGRVVERKQAEEALRLSEAQFRLAFDEGPMAICMIAADQRIVRVNHAFCDLLGWNAEALLGSHLSDYTYAQDRAASERRVEELLGGRADRYVAETHLVNRAGEVLTCCVSAALIANQHGASGYALKLIEDITQRKRMEEKLRESERLAAVGATSAMLAHEVGNPLNGISTTVQMIERDLARTPDRVAPVVFSALADINAEIARLGSLLHEFRFLARPQRLNLARVALSPLVDDVLDGAQLAKRGIEVVVEISADLPPLAVDGEKLKQALANLAENAADAMPDGGALTVRAYRKEDELLLEVGDTGTGIAPGLNVFELFSTTKPNGTGLGLAIVRQIASAHGGRVEYHSEPGKGTVFTVALPVLGDEFWRNGAETAHYRGA